MADVRADLLFPSTSQQVHFPMCRTIPLHAVLEAENVAGQTPTRTSSFKKKNVDQCFPKPHISSSNVLFSPQPKDIQFTVTEEERNQKMFTLKKLESENYEIDLSIIKIVGNSYSSWQPINEWNKSSSSSDKLSGRELLQACSPVRQCHLWPHPNQWCHSVAGTVPHTLDVKHRQEFFFLHLTRPLVIWETNPHQTNLDYFDGAATVVCWHHDTPPLTSAGHLYGCCAFTSVRTTWHHSRKSHVSLPMRRLICLTQNSPAAQGDPSRAPCRFTDRVELNWRVI